MRLLEAIKRLLEAFNKRSVLDYWIFLAVLLGWVGAFTTLIDLPRWLAVVVVLVGLCVAGVAPDALRREVRRLVDRAGTSR